MKRTPASGRPQRDGKKPVKSAPCPDGKLESLTPRETEVLSWIAAGKRDAEIAVILGPSVRTVEKHVQRILHKLGAENRTTAALMLLDHHNGPDGDHKDGPCKPPARRKKS